MSEEPVVYAAPLVAAQRAREADVVRRLIRLIVEQGKLRGWLGEGPTRTEPGALRLYVNGRWYVARIEACEAGP